MKKRFAALFFIVCILLPLAACSKKDRLQQADSKQNPYYPENEIITTEDLDDDRIIIVIDTQYDVPTADIEQAVENRFPEVNVLLRLQNTPDSSYQMQKSLEHGLRRPDYRQHRPSPVCILFKRSGNSATSICNR